MAWTLETRVIASRPALLHGAYGTDNAAASPATGGHLQVTAVFDFESAAPGDPVEDFLWIADHGLDSAIFRSFLAGYLEHGQLGPGARDRFAFYQLEHCLGILRWACHSDPEYFTQPQRLIEQVLDGTRPAHHSVVAAAGLATTAPPR